MPRSLSEEIDSSPHLTPALLGDFHAYMDDLLVSHDMPRLKQTVLKSQHRGRVYNYGTLVRWALALNEIE